MKNKLYSRALSSDLLLIIPLLLVLGITPLIVRLRFITLEGIQFDIWNGEEHWADMFSYYKVAFLAIIGALIFIIFITHTTLKLSYIKKTYTYIYMIVYIIFCIFSVLASEYKDIALFGFVDRCEGLFTISLYIGIMFVAINTINNEKHVKAVIYTLFISSFIIGLVSILQYFELDPLKTYIGKLITLPWKLATNKNLSLDNVWAKSVYGTVYSGNYLGSYIALVLPVCLVTFIACKSKLIKLTSFVLAAILAFDLIVSRSRAGMLGVAVALILFVIVLHRVLLKNYIIVAISLLGIVLLGVGLFYYKGEAINYKLKELFWRSVETKSDFALRDITISGGTANIVTSSETLRLVLSQNRLHFLDDKFKEISYKQDNSNILFGLPLYEKYKVTINKDKPVLNISFDRYSISLLLAREGIFPIGYKGNLIRELVKYPAVGFDGNETFANARGYIWSRSIPMLKDTVFLGHGPDTYAIYFPQDDYVGKLKGFNKANVLVDKPHNFYLQTGINTGVISLLAILAMFGMYFVSSFRIYIRSKYETFYEIAGAGIFLAFVGYAVAALFNDSVVSVAPVFWVLFGTGVSINLKLKQDLKHNISNKPLNMQKMDV